MPSKNGKYFEQLVYLIEQSIQPDARVEHDVRLPILNSKSGSTTQCDIVITTGTPPRETITLVEVQDRKSKVKPNDFRGWQKKLEEVGAQHLICVSRQEFPDSIKEQAALSGNSISLMTLTHLNNSIPLDFIKATFTYVERYCTNIEKFEVVVSEEVLESLNTTPLSGTKYQMTGHEKLFSFDKENLHSLYGLCDRFCTFPDELDQGRAQLHFSIMDDKPVYYLLKGELVRAGLDFEFHWAKQKVEIPSTVLTYSQNEFGTLSWVLEVGISTPSGISWIKLPIVKNAQGYEINSIAYSLPAGGRLSVNMELEH